MKPKPYRMNSFLDIDDDGRDKKAGTKGAWENADQNARPGIANITLYDASSAISVRFKSALIGETGRPRGAFFYPGNA